MRIIHELLRQVLSLFAPGTGRRRAGCRPTVHPAPQSEASRPAVLQPPPPRSPYDLDPHTPSTARPLPSSAPTSSPSSGSRHDSPDGGSLWFWPPTSVSTSTVMSSAPKCWRPGEAAGDGPAVVRRVHARQARRLRRPAPAMPADHRRTAARSLGPAADVRLPVLLPRARYGQSTVKAGRYPENGVSRLTIRVYRIRDDGDSDVTPQQRTVRSGHDTERLPKSHAWPPCACLRCRAAQRADS